jgi:hypothetical protein
MPRNRFHSLFNHLWIWLFATLGLCIFKESKKIKQGIFWFGWVPTA